MSKTYQKEKSKQSPFLVFQKQSRFLVFQKHQIKHIKVLSIFQSNYVKKKLSKEGRFFLH